MNLLTNLSSETAEFVSTHIQRVTKPGDLVIFSIHWGGNWGYQIPPEQAAFAHYLIDHAGVDVVHGHSSHHAKGIEVYRDRLILYGCGDFINDYEGIRGHGTYRGDLCLMYLPSLEPGTGKLLRCQMVPMQIKRFKLNYASDADAQWLRDTLQREGKKLGTHVEMGPENRLELQW